MKELKISPDEFFGTSENVQISINGIHTRVIGLSDEHGHFFAIELTDPSLIDICGDIVLGKLITEIDYIKYQGKTAIIKAYY